MRKPVVCDVLFGAYTALPFVSNILNVGVNFTDGELCWSFGQIFIEEEGSITGE